MAEQSIGLVQSTDYLIDVDELMREIERYLAVVEAFRAAGCDVGGIGRRKGSPMTNERIGRDATRAA